MVAIEEKDRIVEMVFGVHAIVELLKAKKRRIVAIYTTKPQPKGWSRIEPLLAKHVVINYVKREALHERAGTTDHQGIIALATPFEFQKKPFEPSKKPFILFLDSIQDPRNLGAILRSAYCTGVDGVIITQKNSASLNATALKASAGLAEHLSIQLVPSAKAGLIELERAGYNLYVTMLSSKAVPAHKVEYKFPVCVVIGNEEVGISPDVAKLGTHIMLPQKNADISYNASVAAGIILFWISVHTKNI